MNILVIFEKLPYPIRSGADQRIVSLVNHLNNKHNVTLLVQSLPTFDTLLASKNLNIDVFFYWRRTALNVLLLIKKNIDFFLRKKNILTLDDILIQFIKKTDIKVGSYWKKYQEGLDVYVKKITEVQKIDVIIVEYIWLYKAIQKVRGIYLILDTHDVMYRRKIVLEEIGEKFPLDITKEQETMIFNKFNAIISIQKKEYDIIKSMVPTRKVINVGTSVENFTLCGCDNTLSDTVNIVFIGGANQPNLHGINDFIKNVWPIVKKRSKKRVKLIIAGNVCNGLKGKLIDDVVLLGIVDDLQPIYDNADIVINPVWVGSGLKIKTIEAMCNNKVLVTTPIGIDGMEGKPENACIVVNCQEDMINSIIGLIDETCDKNRLKNNLSKYVKRYLSSGAVYKELDALLLNNIKSLSTD